MRTLKLFLSSVLLTVAVAGTAFAQGARPMQHGGARMMQRLDRNHNGVIELAELPPRAQQRLAAADTNRDGVLSPQELQALRQARQAQMDTNHDGTVSREERVAARSARMEARFVRMDVNRDNTLTPDELGARWNRLGRADIDGNGRITREELQNARRIFLARRGFRAGQP